MDNAFPIIALICNAVELLTDKEDYKDKLHLCISHCLLLKDDLFFLESGPRQKYII